MQINFEELPRNQHTNRAIGITYNIYKVSARVHFSKTLIQKTPAHTYVTFLIDKKQNVAGVRFSQESSENSYITGPHGKGQYYISTLSIARTLREMRYPMKTLLRVTKVVGTENDWIIHHDNA